MKIGEEEMGDEEMKWMRSDQGEDMGGVCGQND
jgi:hypothetical protein